MRKTSAIVYQQIKQMLSVRRWQVYEILEEHGPLTSSELFEIFKVKHNFPFRYNANVHSRLNELQKLGLAHEVGTKECSVSGNTVILWDVTGNPPKTITKEEQILESISKFEKKLERLNGELSKLRSSASL